MKRAKITASALVLALLMAMSVLFAACGKTGDDSGNNNGGGTTEPDAPTHSFEIDVEQAPNLTYKSSEDTYVDASVMTDELVIVYDAQKTVTAEVAEGNVTLSAGTSETANGKKTDTYTVTATGTGSYTLNFNSGEEKVETFTSDVAAAYPADPDLPTVSRSAMNVSDIGYVHDPVVVEADGKYYEFNTDNAGGDYGYQVRVSDDLIHWTKLEDPAIENCGKNDSDAKSVYESGKGGLQEVYDILKGDGNWNNSCWTLWAPEVTQAADGGWWLYGSWTTAFGSSHSVIFQCYSKDIAGPYEFKDIIVYSYDGGGIWPNAIDASIYYDADGRMYMAYGSFSGGIYSIELDPQTGLRKDGLSGNDLLKGSSKTQAERYGASLVPNGYMEGPVISYHENVPVYTGDPKSYDAESYEYKNQYYLMGSSNSFSSDYNMRSYVSASPTSGFSSLTGTGDNSGNRVSGSFTWRTSDTDRSPSYEFFAPGHNDMITTSTGKNLIAYHNRTTFGGGNHFLFVSQYTFNSRGDIVMSLNRYAGETVRKVTEDEVLHISAGKYAYAAVTNNRYDSTYNGGYAKEDMVLAENNVLKIGNTAVGSWYLYGDNYIYIEITGGDAALQGNYYGAVMPAYIESQGKGGLTISCLSENGKNTLYLNSLV